MASPVFPIRIWHFQRPESYRPSRFPGILYYFSIIFINLVNLFVDRILLILQRILLLFQGGKSLFYAGNADFVFRFLDVLFLVTDCAGVRPVYEAFSLPL